MAALFWRHFKALFYKNIVIFRVHWLANLLRCLILPVAYGVFLGYATNFFSKPNNFGFGTPTSLYHVEDHFDGSKPLVWVDATDKSGFIKSEDIMKHVTSGFTTSRQKNSVIEVQTLQDLLDMCLSNANGASGCFMGVSFDGIPRADKTDTRAINYTLRADSGAFFVDVTRHTSDLETRLIPLQWAIDQAIIQLTTGEKTPNPMELPFTHSINSDVSQDNRLNYLDLMGHFGGAAFFLAFIGVIYHIAGGLSFERATDLTSHMQAMGALDSARIMSWYTAVAILYLPTWIILAVVWWSRLFTETKLGYMILFHLITGFGIMGWSIFVSVPFNRSSQLSAVLTTALAVILSVIPLMLSKRQALSTALSFFFPSMFYTFILKDFSAFETQLQHPVLNQKDPLYSFTAEPMIIAAVIGVFFWPCAAIYLERWMYGVSNPSNSGFWPWSNKRRTQAEMPSDISINLRHVRKVFNTSFFRLKSSELIAIADLSIDIPSHGIFVLLGPNGAGKSSTLSVLGGLTKATSGTVSFSGNTARPPRGTLGLVPQKNVLFPELSCLQTLRVWNAIKQENGVFSDSDIERLLHDCDLQSKMHDPAGTLSGGQKRKLQLAIGLVGGSKVVLVDECTSGVDPLSRRALWKTLTTYRSERTIILTTHFLDEADFLADRIAVLAAPGKLIASDTPVALKSKMGKGYSIHIKFNPKGNAEETLTLLRTVASNTTLECLEHNLCSYHLKTKDTVVIAAALRLLENNKAQLGVLGYDVLGATIEEIFLNLLDKEETEANDFKLDPDSLANTPLSDLVLSNGRPRSSWAQATTVFHKRSLILRRSWLGPFVALAVGIFGAWWPIRFVQGGFASCAHKAVDPFSESFVAAEFPPFFSNDTILSAPPNLFSIINASLPEVFQLPTRFGGFGGLGGGETGIFNPFVPLADKDTLIQTAQKNFQNFTMAGGLYMDFDKDDYLVVYNMGFADLHVFSVASNLFYSRALDSSTTSSPSGSTRIVPGFSPLPSVQTESLKTLQWLAVLGAAMSVFPAFFTLYVAKERQTSVQAMQLSNGLSNPLGLWLGHFMFDSMSTIIVSIVVAIVYSVVENKFEGVGLMWLVIVLYGFAATLQSYVAAIVIKSPLGAFAVVVVSQFIIYLLYLAAYIATTFSTNPFDAPRTMNIIFFTLALVSPINSLIRAALISVNQFSLLCDGDNIASGPALVSITRFGGPIVYLILWILVLLLVLSQVDTGVRQRLSGMFSSRLRSLPATPNFEEGTGKMGSQKLPKQDILFETQQAFSAENSDPLRVLNVSKSFGRNKVVDDVTFTIPHNSLFVLLGPNGAGKTTTFDMIYGHRTPDSGDVFVNSASVLSDVKQARTFFGVCPQFTAMDPHLTVREHLLFYGRFRGLEGEDLQRNIASIMDATGLDIYSSRLSKKLSGGNQRKLALAIALIGNPSVILVDEYSTGIDAKMKRELWAVLKQVTKNKSVFLTTHSMEEASYLATKVGIMSKRMLAVGTPEELETRTASYEVHFSCHTREELVKVQTVMARIPNARMVDDVATRFEVPIGNIDDEKDMGAISVASIFEAISRERDFPEFTIGKSSLETAFIRIINDDISSGRDGGELEDTRPSAKRLWGLC